MMLVVGSSSGRHLPRRPPSMARTKISRRLSPCRWAQKLAPRRRRRRRRRSETGGWRRNDDDDETMKRWWCTMLLKPCALALQQLRRTWSAKRNRKLWIFKESSTKTSSSTMMRRAFLHSHIYTYLFISTCLCMSFAIFLDFPGLSQNAPGRLLNCHSRKFDAASSVYSRHMHTGV